MKRNLRSRACKEGRHGDCNGFAADMKGCMCAYGSWERGDPRGRHGMVKR